ncbi:hypothetical protein EDB92DRAFT_1944130 [Lactarius akahatsu]|uniref:F-box domain-containing protein n=1 Tax=Lactarius akahatsu TaxID=416441 RepID=A0AAD4LKR7_9AGAM|nr:hypothetical protein EDB92DRAFT_1944130 [Lactarius akahatsu]
MSSRLLSLPTEILVDVLFRLPFQDLIACSWACRRLRALVSDTPLLQYVAYAHRAGVADRFPPGLTVPDRFATLQRWEAAWGRLDAMAPSGGSVVLRKRPHMKTTCMLRDGVLVAACFKDEPADEELAGYAAIDLLGRSGGGWAETQFAEDVVALDVSVAQNLVAMLHVRELDGQNELLLDLLPFDDEGPGGHHIPDLGHIVADGPFSRRKVDLKIAGDFVAVMACGEAPGDMDSFTLVDWRAGSGNNVSEHVHLSAHLCEANQVLSCPANTYAPSFCFIDHETVAHVRLRDNAIETRKILVASDGEIYLRRFRRFDLPFATTHDCRLLDARWSGDHPCITSPKSDRASRLPFQSRLESSVVALTLSYAARGARDQRSFRAVIPRAKLLAGVWDTSSFRLFTLGCQAPACSSWTGGCSISGTRWINQCLQVFDFNAARVRGALAWKRATTATTTTATASPGLPNPIVHATDVPAAPGFERDVSSALPFCHTFPMNQFGDVYDGVLADDERVVAFRYKYNDDGLTMDVVFDVWTL